ncbi:MAG: GlxA family transcriptional regulator [Alphaproteobacteria bacterium]|nr:GlxA family transcriptional regulator [Alphaproteobacteria bacterium]
MLQHFTLTPFAGFVDVLRLAADEGDRSRQIRCSWTVMSADGGPVRSSCGVELTQVSSLIDPCGFSYVVVVGGILHHGDQSNGAVVEYLRLANRSRVPLIGICTGVIALIKSGLMNRKRCCVSWFHSRDVAAEFPSVVPVSDQLFVVDGDRITCAGGGGAIDLAAWLVARHLGSAVALKSLHILMIDRPRQPEAAQPQSPAIPRARDRRVQRAILLIEQMIEDPPTLTRLACHVGVSARQLHRLFKREFGVGASGFARQYRLLHGRHLLKETSLRIADIAMECGFSDLPHFHRAFLSAYGMRPSEFRKAARCEPVARASTVSFR